MGASGISAQVFLLRELVNTSLGGELAIGVILANWLVMEGMGSLVGAGLSRKTINPVGWTVLLQTLFALFLPASLLLSREAGRLFGVPGGSAMGLATLVPASALVLLPVALTHGMLFPLWCRLGRTIESRKTLSPGRVYILEIAGTAAGGAALTLLLVSRVLPEQALMMVSLLNLAVSLPMLAAKPVPRALYSLLPAILLLALLSGAMVTLGENSLRRRWPGLRYHRNTVHGALTVTENQGQVTFHQDGRPLLTTPGGNMVFSETLVHVALLNHPAPERVLVIAGGPGGILGEVLKHSPRWVVWAELDTALPELVRRFPTAETEYELDNPAVSVVSADGRRFLEQTRESFDAVILGTGMPEDLQTNRLYTQEFFELAMSRLKPYGVLAFTLPGSPAYIPEELAYLNALVENALDRASSEYTVIPGEFNLFIAFKSPGSSQDSETLTRRLRERNIETGLITGQYLDYILHERHLERYRDATVGLSATANTDREPIAVFWSAAYGNRVLSPTTAKVFHYIHGVTWRNAVIAMAILFLLVQPALVPLSRRKPGAPVLLAVFTGGFAGMLMELALMYAFQVLFGSLYLWMGLLFACFMAGAAGGAALGDCSRKKSRGFIVLMMTGMIFLALAVPHALKLLEMLGKSFGPNGASLVFLLLPVAAGFFTGGIFPPAAAISGNEGKVYSADLAGGWLGGMISGVFLLPLFGLTRALLLAAGLAAIGLAGLLPRSTRIPFGR